MPGPGRVLIPARDGLCRPSAFGRNRRPGTAQRFSSTRPTDRGTGVEGQALWTGAKRRDWPHGRSAGARLKTLPKSEGEQDRQA